MPFGVLNRFWLIELKERHELAPLHILCALLGRAHLRDIESQLGDYRRRPAPIRRLRTGPVIPVSMHRRFSGNTWFDPAATDPRGR